MKVSFSAIVVFLVSLCFFTARADAELVKNVGADGTLTLEDGKQVVLAGIEMDREGVSVLRVLAQKQDLRLQILSNAAPGSVEPAYAYLRSKYVKFPVKPAGVPDEQEILLNEFLVELGAAKVAEAQDFSRKAKFLKVQEAAKRKGEGLWSYEVS